MSRGPSRPDPTPSFNHISGTDLTDEIRRHLRTLAFVLKQGPGTSVFAGAEVKIVNADPADLSTELQAVLNDLNELAARAGAGQHPSQP